MARKEITWRGMKEEQLKDMPIDEFMKHIPSRARRSLKRGITESQKTLMNKIEKGEKNIKTQVRDIVIVPKMIGKTINIYNGKEFKPITITIEMLGHFLGEFSLSRKNVGHNSPGVGATKSSSAVSVK